MNEEKENLVFKNATLEAIYWWNRDEYYYHKYFSDFENIYKDKKKLNFFTSKIFEIFLREYSVRRNIAQGYQSVDNFINELFKNNFVEKVKDGYTSVIDEVSHNLKINGSITNNKESRSLLSKIAFLINPSDFSLLDTLVKDSLWGIIKKEKSCKRNDLENYSVFLNQTKIQILENSELIKSQAKLLVNFENTNAFKYFSVYPKAFERRIYDKYLWLKIQNENKSGRFINNEEYLRFEKY